MKNILSTNNSYSPLVARIALFIVFFAHGSQKFLGWFGGSGFDSSMNYLNQDLGIPLVLAAIAILSQFFGSILIQIGLLTRVVALGFAVNMIVAIFTERIHHGFFINWENKINVGNGMEMNLMLLSLSIILIISGGGRFSLDRFISSNFKN